MDVILSNFASSYLCDFSLNELIEYKKIIELSDNELYCYLLKQKNIPPTLDKNIMKNITQQPSPIR